MLGNFPCFSSCDICCLFSKLTFRKNSFRNTIRVSNSFESRSFWVQTVYKDHQQTTKVASSTERVGTFPLPNFYLVNLQHSNNKHVFSFREETVSTLIRWLFWIYSRLSLTQLCITQYYHFPRLDGRVPVFSPLYYCN